MNVCRCERPWPGVEGCEKCGRPIEKAVVRRGPRVDEHERRLTFEKALRRADDPRRAMR